MATIDGKLKEILTKWHSNPKAAVWDCHGKWIAYHAALEEIARNASIVFEAPVVLEADGANKCAALCVTGRMLDRTEWSIGEAAPSNNKNGYPFAMAEKRAKDRVILKLIGLHGDVYSEEEADEFRERPPIQKPTTYAPMDDNTPAGTFASGALIDIAGFKAADALETWAKVNKNHLEALPDTLKERVRGAYSRRLAFLREEKAA